MKYKVKTAIVLTGIGLLTLLVYSNHFHNDFHFDDMHTIVDNLYIRDLHNIPLFFSDATTTSTLPLNQAYRPGLTMLNTIDFYLSGEKKPTPFVFHVSIFVSYILLGFLCFLLFNFLLNQAFVSKYNLPVALFTTAWFMLHTANAETINYIIARSDSFSTLMVVSSFCLYLFVPATKKWHLYFIPSLLGFFVKEPSLMFVPLLLMYKLFFEANLNLKEVFSKLSTTLRTTKQILIPFLLSTLIFTLSRIYTPVHWQAGGTNIWKYLFTQPFVIFHYCYNFVLPINLVVDTDWKVIDSFREDQVMIGLLFVFLLLFIAFKTSFNHKTKPITFGILWFFVALIPSSSIIPFAEVLNDHRTFFPYIGLFIAVACLLRNMIDQHLILQKGFGKIGIIAVGLLIIGLNGLGTYERNKIWATEKSLWHDATIKAPNNGRAWMNYGNTLLKEADFKGALICFEKTISIYPNYSYAYINLGIAKSYLNDDIAAEISFKKGIELGQGLIPDLYSFYARFLMQRNRLAEARKMIEQGLGISPKNALLLERLEELKKAETSVNNGTNSKLETILNDIKINATPENYLELSLQYYTVGRYEKCIEAAAKAIQLKPNYDLAYNNICAAYNRLGLWKNAIEAGEKGLKLNSNNQLLRGNLAEAYRNIKK